ncbi:hypothetical protein GHT07_18690 [Caenimonas koreensis DSM 17982]|uniref:Uncharacterized protein n=1 Tax=Caenimonas koreensis DSM 17982 TaxID=1121255 RepID=A0A844BCX6_9BURK|nr:hypothetical protein [Caenimonas koreensis]MRD49307.1 hypothetical protein [Caenimonas koreensis DSM 17982]
MQEGEAIVATGTAQDFFELAPPGKLMLFPVDLDTNYVGDGFRTVTMTFPAIQLHCSSESCNGRRFFDPTSAPKFGLPGPVHLHAKFVCRNCGESSKMYSIRLYAISGDKSDSELTFLKLGEFPAFGPLTPARLLSLFGPDREYFLKGRRAEAQNMGIAAFAYYRRVIENQKDRIFDAVIKVAEKVGSPAEMISDLKLAKSEVQFTKGVEKIRHGIPPGLLVNGHNPLTLVHGALSEGIHALSDEECLELATSIRLVMADLAERMAQAVKDEAELTAALSRLFKPTKGTTTHDTERKS